MKWTQTDVRQIGIEGIRPLKRKINRDVRGFLVETLRSDDTDVNGAHFRMSYCSLTMPGEFRDRDRWHVHRVQTDRFIVVLGEMTLALLDGREDSSTQGRLEVIRMSGCQFPGQQGSGADPAETYLVPIPPGVLHCVGNLSSAPFLLQNYPTELYNPSDEGRVPFSQRPIEPGGSPFAWTEVERLP